MGGGLPRWRLGKRSRRVDEGGRQPSAAGAGDGLLVGAVLAEPGVNQRIINCLSV